MSVSIRLSCKVFFLFYSVLSLLDEEPCDRVYNTLHSMAEGDANTLLTKIFSLTELELSTGPGCSNPSEYLNARSLSRMHRSFDRYSRNRSDGDCKILSTFKL